MWSERGNSRGKVVIISGPSGCGKTTICQELIKDPRVRKSISVTTRPRRPQEKEGRDYYFVTKEEFERKIKEGKFAEYARYSGHLYGTLLEPLEKALEEDTVYLLEIDVQGAHQIMERFPQALSIFILPPEEGVLKGRLLGRSADLGKELDSRLEIAKDELRHASRYRYRVVNDKLEKAVGEVRKILGLDLKEHR